MKDTEMLESIQCRLTKILLMLIKESKLSRIKIIIKALLYLFKQRVLGRVQVIFFLSISTEFSQQTHRARKTFYYVF